MQTSKAGPDASALHHAGKACRGEGRASLAGEHERRLGILLPLQLAQGPHFIADNGMGRRRALLGPADVQDGVAEIDLIPTQVYKLGRPQAVAEGDKDHGGIPVTPAIGLGGIDQPIDLGAGQVLPGPIDRVRFSSRHRDCSIYSGWCHPFQW